MRGLALGTTLPVVESATLIRPKEGEIGDGDGLDVALDISYSGGACVKAQADLAFGKQAVISINVRCTFTFGIQCCRMTGISYYHWVTKPQFD